MPLAICRNCGTGIPWRNTRGSRLADYRCQCGGTLKRNSDAVRASTTYFMCAICRRRRSVLRRVFVTDELARLLIGGSQHVKAGDAICWHHEARCPRDVDGEFHTYVTAREFLEQGAAAQCKACASLKHSAADGCDDDRTAD